VAHSADHLGLTLETVSREITALARQGLIEVGPGRREILIKRCLPALCCRPYRLQRIVKFDLSQGAGCPIL